jgi:hypothetical protein
VRERVALRAARDLPVNATSKAPVGGFSVLSISVRARLGLVVGGLGLLWLAVFWALA